MYKYIATFHSHFGALSYCKALKKKGLPVKLMPVPRKVSSSCGTCVYYENDSAIDLDGCELDAVYVEKNGVLLCEINKSD